MSHNRRGFTMIELAVVFGIGAIFSALLLPAVQSAREAARRVQCKNNMHMLGIAMHNYHDVYRKLPCGWYQHSWNADEPDAFGWGMSILPFLDNVPLYNTIDFNVMPSSQNSVALEALQGRIEYYRCPSDLSDDANLARGGWGTGNYSANFGHLPPPRWESGTLTNQWPGLAATPKQTRGLFWCNGSASFSDVTDGLSNTLMIGERGAAGTNGIWMGVRGNSFEYDAVTDGSRHSPINGGIGTFSSVHERGTNILLCDGAVLFVSDEINMPSVKVGSVALEPGDPDPAYILELLTCRNDHLAIPAF